MPFLTPLEVQLIPYGALLLCVLMLVSGWFHYKAHYKEMFPYA